MTLAAHWVNWLRLTGRRARCRRSGDGVDEMADGHLSVAPQAGKAQIGIEAQRKRPAFER